MYKMYKRYFKYLLEHKKNVFAECWKEGLYIHAFTHDLSKILPSEFMPCAKYFYTNNPDKYKKYFEEACNLHLKRNKHHPEYWAGRDMPIKHIKEMVCDLKAMSRKFGGSAQEYYLQNYYKWDMTRRTRLILELELELLIGYIKPINGCNQGRWMIIEELIKNAEDYFKSKSKMSDNDIENRVNDLLKPACDKYNVNIYQLVKNSKSTM